MAKPREKYLLFVEGKNDLYTIVNLLPKDVIQACLRRWPDAKENGWINVTGDKVKLRNASEVGIKSSGGMPVGVIVDADQSPEGTWESYRNLLDGFGVISDRELYSSGFVGVATNEDVKGTRVGVWIMPDNHRKGKIEDLICDLIPSDDPLFNHAKEATRVAKHKHDAKFSDPDQIKAELHTWLAWQKVPGLPYGTAIEAKFLLHDSPAAQSFVNWFKELFAIGD